MISYLSIIFIIMNIYYLINYKRLDKSFSERDRNSKLDLIYYITKLLSWVWIIGGLFLENNIFYILLLSIGLIRIPLYHINKNWGSLWWRLTPPLHIIIMIIMIFTS